MYPRFIERRIREALADTRVVLLAGPRQSGKTTLAEKFAADGMQFLTLDDQTTLDTARADPVVPAWERLSGSDTPPFKNILTFSAAYSWSALCSPGIRTN
jgi:hypothetical protein